ncbi:hypothetical protein QBC36DRAFT_313484 [Triangularia setosa]|uniref:Uncharacterized protein n=1 Tax=Triangularia setosa TaxID=2587417 RepID=A0AAN7A672_9PEZI|nr:hypothetical protein QBC36DRAFT_313484 [Podospora setosa]
MSLHLKAPKDPKRHTGMIPEHCSLQGTRRCDNQISMVIPIGPGTAKRRQAERDCKIVPGREEDVKPRIRVGFWHSASGPLLVSGGLAPGERQQEDFVELEQKMGVWKVVDGHGDFEKDGNGGRAATPGVGISCGGENGHGPIRKMAFERIHDAAINQCWGLTTVGGVDCKENWMQCQLRIEMADVISAFVPSPGFNVCAMVKDPRETRPGQSRATRQNNTGSKPWSSNLSIAIAPSESPGIKVSGGVFISLANYYQRDQNAYVQTTGAGSTNPPYNACRNIECKKNTFCENIYQEHDDEDARRCPLNTGEMHLHLCMSDGDLASSPLKFCREAVNISGRAARVSKRQDNKGKATMEELRKGWPSIHAALARSP